jgi:hypothetical protein
MARKKEKKKGSGCGCLVILALGVGFVLYLGLTTPPLPPADPSQAQADRIRVLTEKEAAFRQNAAEYRAKAKAEIDRYPPEVAEGNERMAREENRHYGHKKFEANAQGADRSADEIRREIERLKAGGGQ